MVYQGHSGRAPCLFGRLIYVCQTLIVPVVPMNMNGSCLAFGLGQSVVWLSQSIEE
jgi:hypothetical protein